MRWRDGHPSPSSQSSQASSLPLNTGPSWLGSTTVARAKPFLPTSGVYTLPATLVPCSDAQHIPKMESPLGIGSPDPSPSLFP